MNRIRALKISSTHIILKLLRFQFNKFYRFEIVIKYFDVVQVLIILFTVGFLRINKICKHKFF